MKKLFAHFALLIVLILMASPFDVAQAQTLTRLATQELTPLMLPAAVTPAAIGTPTLVPSLNAVPFTPEAPPADTQETLQTGIPAGTAARGSTTSTQESADLNLPEPELPILDIGANTQETQETSQLCASAAASQSCLDPSKAEATILPPVIGNQIKISLLVFLGAILGSLLWVLSNFFLNTARGRREILRLARQQRLAGENLRLENLREYYGRISDPLSRLFKPSGNKLLLDAKALSDYRSAAVSIEMFGSNEALEAHRKLSGLLSQAKLPPLAEIESASSDLIAALQKDLGLNPAGPSPRHPSGTAPTSTP